MHFSIISTIIFFGIVHHAISVPTPNVTENTIPRKPCTRYLHAGEIRIEGVRFQCDTSRGVGHINNIRIMVGKLIRRNPNDICARKSEGSSFCQEVVTDGDAAVGVCSDHNKSVILKCGYTAYAADTIAFHCAMKGFAGGVVMFDSEPVEATSVGDE